MKENILKNIALAVNIKEKIKDYLNVEKIKFSKKDKKLSYFSYLNKKESLKLSLMSFFTFMLTSPLSIFFINFENNEFGYPMLSLFFIIFPLMSGVLLFTTLLEVNKKNNLKKDIIIFDKNFEEEKENLDCDLKNTPFFDYLIKEIIGVKNKISLDMVSNFIGNLSDEEINYIKDMNDVDIKSFSSLSYEKMLKTIDEEKDEITENDFIKYNNELNIIFKSFNDIVSKEEKLKKLEIANSIKDYIINIKSKSINNNIENDLLNQINNQKISNF